MNDCQRLIIPLVNEIFQKSYNFSDSIIMNNNEHYINEGNGEQEKRISDSNFLICGERYQIECQSSYDGSMIIRVWEYGTQIALENAREDKDENAYHFKYPNTAILYLRSTKNTPEHSKIYVEVPGDSSHNSCYYYVYNIKVSEYSIDDIFEKKLYFLLPFHLFVYEGGFKSYNDKEELLLELKQKYSEIFKRLDSDEVELTTYEKETIKDMSKKILKNLANDYQNIKKELGDVMGGKILNYEAKDILMQGRKEGREEGKLDTLFDLFSHGFCTLDLVLDRTGLTKDEFLKKYENWKIAKNV